MVKKDTISIRTDMDAINLTEEGQHPYTFQNSGKMHGSGHAFAVIPEDKIDEINNKGTTGFNKFFIKHFLFLDSHRWYHSLIDLFNYGYKNLQTCKKL
ncbi:hypothetical protein IC621_24650 [Bacillus sp. IB182487]|uniref:Uncharacterized protein n=1 Tax=Metabacillus arenae TaxID=2771434 RepID=A0A926NLP6_9BACI|nr:hypothetical protein [Metabacillus arenae]